MMHLSKRLPPHLRSGGFCIERVAREQDNGCAMVSCMLRKPADGIVPRFSQSSRQVAFELAKTFTQMQVA